jgi:flagellar biogenesis protein FliO
MRQLITPSHRRRGITVLGLLLLIIALVAAAVFLVRYLRSRPAAVSVVTALVIPSPSLRSGQAPRGI